MSLALLFHYLTLSRRNIYICRAVSPLNGQMAIKVDGVGGRHLIPAPKGFEC